MVAIGAASKRLVVKRGKLAEGILRVKGPGPSQSDDLSNDLFSESFDGFVECIGRDAEL